MILYIAFFEWNFVKIQVLTNLEYIYIYVVHTFCLRQGSHLNLHVVDSRNIEGIKMDQIPKLPS